MMNFQSNNNNQEAMIHSSLAQQLHEKLSLSEATTPLEETQSETDASTASEQSVSERDISESTKETTPSRTTVVGFGSVHIREFDRIVGDHPDVGQGPPLSIGWDYLELEGMSLDAYEQEKRDKHAQKVQDAKNCGGWAPLPGLRKLSSGRRRDMLRIDFDIPLRELEQAEADVEKTKKQREQTNKQKKVFTRTEEILQSAQRKLKRTFSRDSPDYQSFPKRLERIAEDPRPPRAESTSGVSVTIRRGSSSSTITQIRAMPKPLRMREISV